jgi:polyisoprenoid-binding protein YceI
LPYTQSCMTKLFLLLNLLTLSPALWAQRFISERSQVSFYSETPLENIDARNAETTSLFDVANGQIVFSVPIQSFVFAKSLMQQHFNENYLESEKYPKATFKGTVSGFSLKAGSQKVTASGDLLIHGVSRRVTTDGVMEMSDGKIRLLVSFPVKLEDYQVKVPKVVFYKIAQEVMVKMDILYKPYEK